MKKILLPLAVLAVVFATSCTTTKKLYEAGAYDEVIMKEAPKVCSGRINVNKLGLIASAYHRANEADHERIQALKASGQPDVWPEIYERFRSMKGRNEALACFPKKVKQDINYTKLNLDEELTAARNKAEAYLTAKTKQLLETGTPTNIQEAKKLTRQLMHVNPESSLIGEYQLMAMIRQTARLETEFEYNDRRRPLPEGIDQAVMQFDQAELSRFPIAKDNCVIASSMIVEVTDFFITPDKDETVSFKETNEGLTATVTDHTLSKSAKIKADITFIYKDKESITGSEWNVFTIRDIEATSLFNYSYTTVEGPKTACSAQTLERLTNQPIPFPTDISILLDAAKKLNDLIAEQLSK